MKTVKLARSYLFWRFSPSLKYTTKKASRDRPSLELPLEPPRPTSTLPSPVPAPFSSQRRYGTQTWVGATSHEIRARVTLVVPGISMKLVRMKWSMRKRGWHNNRCRVKRYRWRARINRLWEWLVNYRRFRRILIRRWVKKVRGARGEVTESYMGGTTWWITNNNLQQRTHLKRLRKSGRKD